MLRTCLYIVPPEACDEFKPNDDVPTPTTWPHPSTEDSCFTALPATMLSSFFGDGATGHMVKLDSRMSSSTASLQILSWGMTPRLTARKMDDCTSSNVTFLLCGDVDSVEFSCNHCGNVIRCEVGIGA
jgi:predicted RNA-binding Zn-ribbon protein involved in translation (DUF1610 family)